MTNKTTHFVAGITGALVALLIIFASERLGEPEMPAEVAGGAPGAGFLMARDREYSATSAAEGPEAAWTAFMAEDAVILPDGNGMRVGLAEVMAPIKNWPDDARFTWRPEAAEMAASGELGYTWGVWSMTYTDADGTNLREAGRYLSIWRLQADGSWKVVLDMGNDLPAEDTEQSPARARR